MKPEFRYRYVEETRFRGDASTDMFTSADFEVYLDLLAYPVLRHTKKGAWIRCGLQEKFVLDTAKKKFAHPTCELALDSFIARKTRQLSLLESQMTKARHALRLAEDSKARSLKSAPSF